MSSSSSSITTYSSTPSSPPSSSLARSSSSASSTLVVPHAGVCDAFLYLSEHGLPSYKRYMLFDALPGTSSSDAKKGKAGRDGSCYQALTKSKGRFFRVLSRLFDEATEHDSEACVMNFTRHQDVTYHYNVDVHRLLPGQRPLPEHFDDFLSAQGLTPTWLPSFLARPSCKQPSDAPFPFPSYHPRLFPFWAQAGCGVQAGGESAGSGEGLGRGGRLGRRGEGVGSTTTSAAGECPQ